MLFAKVPDPDISGHLILEQFQAQVKTKGDYIVDSLNDDC